MPSPRLRTSNFHGLTGWPSRWPATQTPTTAVFRRGGFRHVYLPGRGNFDIWAKDPEGGGKLNLAELDWLPRNHILEFSFAALPPPSRQLLPTLLALLSEAVDLGHPQRP